MLHGISVFFLLVFAFVGTYYIIFNPIRKIGKISEGKTKKEISAQLSEHIKETSGGKLFAEGCGVAMSIGVSLFYQFLVEPIIAIGAIVNESGYKPAAYVALVIILVSWIDFFTISLRSKNKAKKASTAIITVDGNEVEPGRIEIDEPLDLGNPIILNAKRVLYSIPTFYIWYVFLVAIRVLH